jgi:hypothetical protein
LNILDTLLITFNSIPGAQAERERREREWGIEDLDQEEEE